MDDILATTVLCQGGLDSTENHILLDANFPGKASRLVNFEPGLNGGYRRLSGFQYFDPDNPEIDPSTSEGPVLGIFIYRDNSGDATIIAARKEQSGATYNFYEYQGTGPGWVPYTVGFSLSNANVYRVRAAQFNFGNVNYIIFVDGANPATLFDGTNWYSLDSAGAGTSMDPGGDQILDKPSAVAVFANHIFLASDTDFPGLICHSAPEDPFDWTAASGGGQLIAGFKTVQLETFRDNLYVFGQNNISAVSVNNTSFVIKQVTTNIGTIAKDSVVEINGDVIFLAPDGVRPVSGTARIGDVELAVISKDVQEYVNTLEQDFDLKYLCTGIIRGKSQFRYFVSNGLVSDLGKGLIGALRGADSTSWEFGELSGIQANCVDSDYDGDTELVLHGDFSGNVFRQEVGNDFNGAAVTSVYSTPYLTFGDSFLRKRLREIHTFYRLEGAVNVNVSLDFDWGLDNVHEPESYPQTSSSLFPVYGDGSEYGDGSLYGGGTRSPVISSTIAGSCFSVRFTFASSNTNAPHSFQGFVVEYTNQGRR